MDDFTAMKKFGAPFRFQERKGYVRRAKAENGWGFPLLSRDGLHWRLDRRIARVRNRLRI